MRDADMQSEELGDMGSPTVDSLAVVTLHRRHTHVVRWLSVLALSLGMPARASATWSVIGVDKEKASITVSGATCVAQQVMETQHIKSLFLIQAVVAPGIGAAVEQANVDLTGSSQANMFQSLRLGRTPSDIVDGMRGDPNSYDRQVSILDVKGRFSGFTGVRAHPNADAVSGLVAATPFAYAIQGDFLASVDAVSAAKRAFVKGKGSLTERVMAAMEAIDAKGGDQRCSCASFPRVDAPCVTKTAQVAYVARVDRTDKVGESFSDGQYAMYISVTDRDTKPSEDANPVKTLRLRYEAWKARAGVRSHDK
jgi:uncharacterized Ntn-hydrolase superfamily protein